MGDASGDMLLKAWQRVFFLLMLSSLRLPTEGRDVREAGHTIGGVRSLLGNGTAARIVGGNDASKNRFPYMCSLKDDTSKHTCGAVLINPKFAVTAAHCVHAKSEKAINLGAFLLIAAHELTDTVGVSGVEAIGLTSIHTHPTFLPTALERGGDIAVLELSLPSTATPIKLPNITHPEGTSVLALGWGTNGNVLQQLPLVTQSDEKCRNAYPNLGQHIACAHNSKGDTCRGDSGGPLLIADAPGGHIAAGNPSLDTLLGLTSFGDSDCRIFEKPGAYTLVAPYVDWIEDIMEGGSGTTAVPAVPPSPSPPPQLPSPAVFPPSPPVVPPTPVQAISSPPTPRVTSPPPACTSAGNCDSLDVEFISVCSNGNASAVQELLAQGTIPDSTDSEGYTCLSLASGRGHEDTVKVLLAAGAQVDYAPQNNGFPLHFAAHNGHLEVVRMLIEAGAPLEAQYGGGFTALINAAYNGHIDIVRLLIQAGANVRALTDRGLTALHSAASRGFGEVAEALVAAGADVNVATTEGTTPLILAASNDHASVGKILLAAGADVDGKDEEGVTALIIAALNGSFKTAAVLIEAGADKGAATSHGGTTPLINAIIGRNFDIANLLIASGANVSQVDIAGWTPLHFAAKEDGLSIAKVLLAVGAKVSAQSEKGITYSSTFFPAASTPLHVAARRGYIDMAKVLLKSGADKELRDSEGYTPQDVVLDTNSALFKLLG